MKPQFCEDSTIRAFSIGGKQPLKSVKPLKTKVAMLRDLVAIRRLDPKEFSDGGIALLPGEDITEDIGEVVEVGPGKYHQCDCGRVLCLQMEVKVGDKVLFSPNGHQLTQVNGEQLIVIRQDGIMGVIE